MDDDDYESLGTRRAGGKRKRADEDEISPNVASGDVDVDDEDQMAVDALDGVDFDIDDLDEETIQKIVNEAPEMEALDPSSVKKLVANFEKAFTKNQQQRAKFADQPEKFMESEVELDAEIKRLQGIATTPSLYPELMKFKSHLSLLGLVSHENTDISVDAVEVIEELTDGEPLTESPDTVLDLIDDLLANQCLQVLVQNMKRLNETIPEEKVGVYKTLSVVENFLEARSQPTIDAILNDTDLVPWLLNRVKPKPFDDVKGYAAEILAILSQNSKEVPLLISRTGGIDTLLFSLNNYKKTNPESLDEEEMIENIFDALCVIAPLPECQRKFTEAETLHLVQILIKNKKFCRKGALKLLDHSLQNSEENCKLWVEIGGLSKLFGAFMKKGAGKHKMGYDEKQDDEHCVSAIVSLFKHLAHEGKLWQRVLAKFQENDYEKVERLVEMHVKYLGQVLDVEDATDKKRRDLEAEGIEVGDAEEADFYLDKLDAGLFTLQLVARIIGIVCSSDPNIKEKLSKLLAMQNLNVESVKVVLRDYAQTMGDDEEDESEGQNNDDQESESAKAKMERRRILVLAEQL